MKESFQKKILVVTDGACSFENALQQSFLHTD